MVWMGEAGVVMGGIGNAGAGAGGVSSWMGVIMVS